MKIGYLAAILNLNKCFILFFSFSFCFCFCFVLFCFIFLLEYGCDKCIYGVEMILKSR